jgi:hypothetical protein
MPLSQPALGRECLRVAGGSPEPAVPIAKLVNALAPDEVEAFRPLLPVGYAAGVRAYQQAAQELTPRDLASHYTNGRMFFHEQFVPYLKQTLESLSGGIWRLDDFVAYAAGTDVDFMTHLIDSTAVRQRVCLYPGDWFGFLVGCTQTGNIHWDARGGGELSCLCLPSVRNGHVTEEMIQFLQSSRACLLNVNLFPTLLPEERFACSQQILPVLNRSILSVSFSRGFGLTASQLGVALVHRDHPYRKVFQRQWDWFTNFYNALAARAFMLVDLERIHEVDEQRRRWVSEWLASRDLPSLQSGSYYVKSFQPIGEIPQFLMPLKREQVLRLCFKPPVSII